MKLHVDYRPIGQLLPYVRNARTHSAEQVAQIAASVQEFGWTNPVLVDGDGVILAGHGRVLAARQLGMREVPVIELAHMDDAQRRAYVLADNKIAGLAGWDEGVLAQEIAALQSAGFDVAIAGFDAQSFCAEVESIGAMSEAEVLDADEGEIDAPLPGHDDDQRSEPIQYPVYAVLSKREYDRWRSWRSGHRSDSVALMAAMDVVGC